MSFEYFLERSLGHPAAFIKRALFEGCLYTETLKIVSDWEFFVKKIVLESCSYRHVERVISIFNMQGISSVSLSLCEEEKKYILQGIFPPMILDSLQLAACLKKQPLFELFREMSKTHRFQKRVKPVLTFLLKLNNAFSMRK